MAITALPTPPSRSDPTNFAARGDAFLGALPTFQVEANALAAAMNLNSTTDTSSSSVSIGTGAKTFTVSSGKSFQPGMYLVIADTAAPSTNSLFGQITSYSSTTLVMNIITIRGSGTISAWTISQSSAGGAQAGPLATSGITGAASSGLNSDITSLTGLTTPLSVAQGGTGLVTGVDGGIKPVTASVSASTLVLGINPCTTQFRSTTLTGAGLPTNVSNNAALSLVVPSGATLGTISAVQSTIILLEINNTGTKELAAVNLAGGTSLNEEGLINTTAITAGATSASVIYSTSARTGVAYRVVGSVTSTQTTAGTWAQALTSVVGAGGNALDVMSSLGYGQTWQNLTGSRALGTTYYNTTGRPILVNVSCNCSAATNGNMIVNGVNLYGSAYSSASTAATAITVIVPPGGSYSHITTALTLNIWNELR